MGEDSDPETRQTLSAETTDEADDAEGASDGETETDESGEGGLSKMPDYEASPETAIDEGTNVVGDDPDAVDGSEVAADASEEDLSYQPPDVSLDPDQLSDQDEEFEQVGEPDFDDENEDDYDPIQDEEMPLADHIEEMVKRLAVIIIVAGIVSVAVFFTPVAEFAINFLWDSVLPTAQSQSARPRVYGPLALIFTEFKVASLAGVIVAMPVLVYETYQFMKPGLYPHERRYYLAAVPTSLVLAVVGVAFAYWPVLPLIFQYFFYYSEDVTVIAFGLSKTFNLILLMMGYLAVVFQIPLFIMLAIMMGVTTRDWLASRRLYFWGGFLGISFLFAFDPTGMAPFMVAATMIALFEGTLVLLKWAGR